MTDRHKLSDEEWERLLPILKNTPGIYIVFPPRCRQFVDAVLWILRTGSQWRQLSAWGLNLNSVFKHFSRWSKLGVWQTLFESLAQDADLQNICIDSSVIRAHACAVGARVSCIENEALGRSRGGLGTRHQGAHGRRCLGFAAEVYPQRWTICRYCLRPVTGRKHPNTNATCRQRLRYGYLPDVAGQQRHSGCHSAQGQPERTTAVIAGSPGRKIVST